MCFLQVADNLYYTNYMTDQQMWLNVAKEVGSNHKYFIECLWTVCEKSSLHIFLVIAMTQ